ncbi:MAG: GNAT family protein [Anaerolineae bacterium]
MTVPTNFLHGERLRLTAINEADIQTMLVWYNDAAFLQLYDSRPAVPRTLESLKAEIEDMQKSQRDFAFAIKLLDDDTCIGYAEIDGIQWQHGSAGLGMGFGSAEHRGKGFGTEAGKLVLRFAFEELNLHRLTATVFSYNAVSIHLCQKLGFVQEGVYREFLLRGGQRHDMLLFGLLRPEWQAAHGQ